ncbi:MAG: transposase [Fibrobacteres bacterium]|nr:transposase [Fibrobacterota bacterium]
MPFVSDLDEHEEHLLEHRRKVAQPKMDERYVWKKAHYSSLQTSRMQDTVRYALNAEAGLKFVREQARCDLDNKVVERAIRTVAIGRKNWMFAGSPKGVKRLACLQSILGSCRILSINVDEYLTEILMEAKRRLKAEERDFEDLTQWRWKQERDKARDDATIGEDSHEVQARIEGPGPPPYDLSAGMGKCGSPKGLRSSS